MERYLTIRDASEKLDIKSLESVRSLCRDGYLRGARQNSSGHWEIPLSAVLKLKRQKERSSKNWDEFLEDYEKFKTQPLPYVVGKILFIVLALATLLGGAATIEIGGKTMVERLVEMSGLEPLCKPAVPGETLVLIAPFYHAENILGTNVHNTIAKSLRDNYQTLISESQLSNGENFRVDISRDVMEFDAEVSNVLAKCRPTLFVTGSFHSGEIQTRIHLGDRSPSSDNFLSRPHAQIVPIKTSSSPQKELFGNRSNSLIHLTEIERTPKSGQSDYATNRDFHLTDLPLQITFLAFNILSETLFQIDGLTESVQILDRALLLVDSLDRHANAYMNGFLLTSFVRLAAQLDILGEEISFEILSCKNSKECYQRAAAIELVGDSLNETSLFNRGFAHWNLQNYQEAQDDYSKVIEMNDSNISALYNRASVYFVSGQYEKSMQDIERVSQLDPDLSPAYLALGNIHFVL